MAPTRGDYSVICFLLVCIGLSVTEGDPRPGEIVLCQVSEGKLPSLLSKCTHILFSTMYTDNFFTNDKLNFDDELRKLVAERKEKPNLKIFIQTIDYEPQKTLKSVSVFTKNVIQFLLSKSLDGLVYNRVAREPVEEIIKKLKEEMSEHNLLLLYSLRYGALEDHPVSKITGNIDHFIVYNLDGWSYSNTVPLSPLKSKVASAPSLDGIVKYVLDQGTLPSKVIIPLSFKGRIYSRLEKSKGVFGEEAKFETDLSYNEICPIIKNGTRYWDEESQTPLLALDEPFCYREGECIGPYSVISYDDSESLAKKVQYGKKNRLGGLFVEYTYRDDNKGACGEGKQPLLNAAIAELNRPIAAGILGTDPSP